MPVTSFSGGCQCGNVRYHISGEPIMAAVCHCTMCRRASAAPLVAWAMFTKSQLQFTKHPPKAYASSPGVERGFCANCGTQISFTASFIPGLIDITLGSLDHPDAIKPELHYWYAEHLAWVELADGLPRHTEFPSIKNG